MVSKATENAITHYVTSGNPSPTPEQSKQIDVLKAAVDACAQHVLKQLKETGSAIIRTSAYKNLFATTTTSSTGFQISWIQKELAEHEITLERTSYIFVPDSLGTGGSYELTAQEDVEGQAGQA